MLDTQRLTLEKFLLGYKHGVYIFTSDACSICTDYKAQLEWVKSPYLYFVEVVTDQEKAIVRKVIDRIGFPATVAYLDNEIKFIELGGLSDIDWAKFMHFLDNFGDKPLLKSEIEKRIEKQKNRCLLTYYIFPTNIDSAKREALMNKGADMNEFPIDIDTVCPTLDKKERERMIEGCYHFAKMVLWKDKTATNSFNYTSFSQDILIGYTNANQEVKFITREF